MAIVGTHNSMSYLKPKYWFLKPFNFIAKCQSLSIEEQSNICNIIDVRVYWDVKTNKWEFAHGSMSFKSDMDVYDVCDIFLKGCRERNEWPHIRIILEKVINKKNEEQEFKRFSSLCNWLETIYGTQITFMGGNYKKTWKKLYQFKGYNVFNDAAIHQFVGSMAEDARWYEKIIPWLYAKRMNKKNQIFLRHTEENNAYIFDFIQIK